MQWRNSYEEGGEKFCRVVSFHVCSRRSGLDVEQGTSFSQLERNGKFSLWTFPCSPETFPKGFLRRFFPEPFLPANFCMHLWLRPCGFYCKARLLFLFDFGTDSAPTVFFFSWASPGPLLGSYNCILVTRKVWRFLEQFAARSRSWYVQLPQQSFGASSSIIPRGIKIVNRFLDSFQISIGRSCRIWLFFFSLLGGHQSEKVE